MTGISWNFKKATAGDRPRESQVEKFFKSDAVSNKANAIVREGIQNSLDAAPASQLVTIKIRVAEWSPAEAASRLPRYLAGFAPHFDAVKSKLPSCPEDGDTFRYLVFEDFGTTGLSGNPEQWWPDDDCPPNSFFNYFRSEGLSEKSDGARGRHGVGRLVFMFASKIRSVFGLTRRGDGEELLMGTAVLRNHKVGSTPFLLDAWYGIPSHAVDGLTLPISEREFLRRFSKDFNLSRGSENGLSVIVPWLSEEVTEAEISKAVIQGYFHPILRGKLVVTVVSDNETITIDRASISTAAQAYGTDFYSQVRPIIELTKESLATQTRIEIPPPLDNPKWSAQSLPDEARAEIQTALANDELVAISIAMTVRPKTGDNAGGQVPCSFDIFLRRDADAREGQISFVREGIVITDARHTNNRQLRCPGVRALAVIDEGPLASFLGDCENPSHTEWQHSNVKTKYTLAKQHLEYVVGAIPGVLKLASENSKEPDETLLLDLFALPSGEPGDPARSKEQSKKKGPKSGLPKLKIPTRTKRLSINQNKDGFVIGPGDGTSALPELIDLLVAYDVRRGSPFKRYNKADFRLFKGRIKHQLRNCRVLAADDNWATFEVLADDFEIKVTGFGGDRDIRVSAVPKDSGVSSAAQV